MKKLLSIALATAVNLFAATQTIGGISWLENEPSGYFSWQEANSWCTNQGYRLPTISELTTVWEASGSTPSPTGFEKNTFYWASDVTSDGHQVCAMDYDCSKNSISTSGIADTSFGHPKCVIDSSNASSSVSSNTSISSSSSSSVSSNVNQSSSSSSTVTTPILVELSSINLNAGWNLISIPGNIKVSTLFNSGDIIYKYINHEWKLYDAQTKSFNEISVGEGFWIKTPTSRTQSVSLTQVDSTKLTTLFGKGWNLIGMNKDVLKENLTFNYSYIYTYNNSKWLSTSEITKLEKYKGYWIKFDQLITKLSDFYLSNGSSEVPYISLKPIDDAIEDELANAILKSQEAITLMNITENKFSMGTNIDWRLDYYNMAKSYQQAVSSLQELIDIHEKMETQYKKRVLKNARAYKCDTNIDPYCIPEATHKKIDFYLDHFGETTPKGNKIDIKTITKQTKQDISFISGLIKDKYGKVFEKETREAAKWEHYENTAKAISDGADIITAVSGVGTGVKVFKSGFMYATKKKGIMTLFKNQVTRPSSLTDTLYDGLRSKYFTAWSKKMAELAIKSKGNIVKGTWDIGSNVIGLYKKASDFGYVPKSNFVNVTDGLFTIANFAKDHDGVAGIKSIMIVSSTIDATKKDIIFLSNTLFEAFSYSDNKDMPNLNKEMLEILYDEDGNLKISMQELTSEDVEKIATELDKKTLDDGLHKGDYEYVDENDVEQKKQVTNEIDLDNVDKEYQKNEIDNSSNEFNTTTIQSSSSSSSVSSSQSSSSSSSSSVTSYDLDSDGVVDSEDNCKTIFGASDHNGCPKELITNCQEKNKKIEYYDNGSKSKEYCTIDEPAGSSSISWFSIGPNKVGKATLYDGNGKISYEANFATAWTKYGNAYDVLIGPYIFYNPTTGVEATRTTYYIFQTQGLWISREKERIDKNHSGIVNQISRWSLGADYSYKLVYKKSCNYDGDECSETTY